MALTINTNVASINAQRNLTQSQSALNQSLQRLSTGLRINSAKDDAAGLAISERFTTQIRGLNQAARNANDGISLSQTSESALSEVSNNLQRIRELAIQSVNATNSASDRAALNDEVQQRLAEIDRIATQTSFNGLKTLNGTFGSATFQVGANVGETIGVTLGQGVRTNQIGQIASATNTVTANALGDGDVTLQVGTGQVISVGASVSGSAKDKASAIQAAGVAGLTVSATTQVSGAVTQTSYTGAGGSAGSTYTLAINGTTIINEDGATDYTLTTTDIVDAINSQSDTTGVTAGLVGTTLTLTDIDGDDIDVDQTVGGGTGQTGTGVNATSFNVAGELSGSITLSATEQINITGGGDIGFGTQVSVDSTTLSTGTVETVNDANDLISRVDAALTTVSNLRSEFGALQSRFESTITNLQTVSESLEASRGRIRDADFAAETANLTKNQILQQAGVSILSQANQQPQLALSLLQ